MYHVWPVVVVGEQCSVPLDILVGVWGQIVEQRRDCAVFYDGGCKTPEDWVRFLLQPTVYPLLVVDDTGPTVVLVTWLTEMGNGSAKVHFCGVGPFKRGAYRAALEHWDSWDQPELRVLVGLTPETNHQALRATKIMGFQQIGTIPDICPMAHEGRRVGGVVSYRKRGG